MLSVLPTGISLNLTLNVVSEQQKHLVGNLRPIWFEKMKRNCKYDTDTVWELVRDIEYYDKDIFLKL